MGKGVNGVVEEVMRIYRSLPTRPTIEEVEAAMAVVKDAERTEQLRLDEIMRKKRPTDVPDDLFGVLTEMQRNLILMQSKEEKKEAMAVLDLEKWYKIFDDLLQRASEALSGEQPGNRRNQEVAASFPNGGVRSVSNTVEDFVSVQSKGLNFEGFSRVSKDDSFVEMPNKLALEKRTLESDAAAGSGSEMVKMRYEALKTQQQAASFGKSHTDTGNYEGKLSLIKLANLIEATAKKGADVLNLDERLVDQVEWLPDSIGKLTTLVELNLSNNHIVTIPDSIGGLSRLTKLDLHSNQLYSLPDAIGELSCLIELDLHANQLRSLSLSIGNLANLVSIDLSCNQLTHLPESIGRLSKLKRLIIETNEIEELPYTIGNCTSLTELRADFNHLKALPEAVGKLAALEILTFHYNKVRSLPTTVGNLANLKELDASFNELESIPENLCFATNLVKLNVGRNFADLQSLPRSIGELEMLEELDISSNQIKVLPDSFALLKRLRVLRVEEVPLEIPPMDIAKLGAQAVVEYMAELVNKRNEKPEVNKQRSLAARVFSCLRFWKKGKSKGDQIQL